MADGEVVIDIRADYSDFDHSLSTVTGMLSQASSNWGAMGSGVADTFFSFFYQHAAQLGEMLGDALREYTEEGLNLASDLEETQHRIEAIFGMEKASQINEWADQTKKDFGLTEQYVKNAFASLAFLYQTSGHDTETAIKMAQEDVERAADLMSFYDNDFETSYNKIRAAMSKRSYAIKEYGVDVSVAAMTDYAKQNGYGKYSTMTLREQQLLIHQKIMEDTALVAGDFQKTRGSYANLQRVIGNTQTELQTAWGKMFLNAKKVEKGLLASFLEYFAYGDSEKASKDLMNTFSEHQRNTSNPVTDTINSWIMSLFGASNADSLINQGKQMQEEREYTKDQYEAMAQSYVSELSTQIAKGVENGYGDSMIKYQRQMNLYANEDFSTYDTDELVTTIDHLEDVLTQVYKTMGVDENDQIFSNLSQSLDQSASEISAAGSSAASGMYSASFAANSLSSALSSASSAASSSAPSISGKIHFRKSSTPTSTSNIWAGYHANGLDYVPYDGYLALLHQGERVQTAAEASLSRRYTVGTPQSFDYGAMGSAIGAHMPQGNMQIIWRGKVVADILSEQQANSYRSIERSRWQG